MSDLTMRILSQIVDTFPNSAAKEAFVLATEIADMVDSDREVNHPTVDFNFEYMESAQIATLRAQVDQLTADRDRAIDRANAYSRALYAQSTAVQPGDTPVDVIAKLHPKLLELAAGDLKIPAIRLVKDQANCALVYAKNAVDDAWPILRREAQHAARTANQSL